MGASSKGTKAYFSHRSAGPAPMILGPTGFEVSRVGFGGYRISEHDPDHREALRLALTSGINLIDTSTNYTDGSSERLVGEVINTLMTEGKLTREQVVIVTKAGYVQGQNLVLAKQKVKDKTPFREMVETNSECWNCIHPEFLEDQITRSLVRLKLDQIDVFLLHNPEYLLKAITKEAYYGRIKKAFEHLESEVAKGRIQYYGVSSNTFVESGDRPDFTSLVKLQEIADAQGSGKKNHFAVVQAPFNLYESGGAFLKNNAGQTFLEFANKNGLGVLLNRPLNALARDRMVRLSSFPAHDNVAIKGDLHLIMGRVVELEKRFAGGQAPKGLMWGHALRESYQQIEDILQWRDVLYHQILPALETSLERLSPSHDVWAREYRENALNLLSLMSKNLEGLAAGRSQLLAEQIADVEPQLKNAGSLSQVMIQLYQSLPAVTSVLVGMRTEAYVRDSLGVQKPLPEADAMKVLTHFRK